MISSTSSEISVASEIEIAPHASLPRGLAGLLRQSKMPPEPKAGHPCGQCVSASATERQPTHKDSLICSAANRRPARTASQLVPCDAAARERLSPLSGAGTAYTLRCRNLLAIGPE